MTNYIYNSHGQAVGVWRRRYVYELSGTPIGQLNGTHALKGITLRVVGADLTK